MKQAFIFFALVLLFAQSCNRPDGSIELESTDREFAIPLINSKLDIESLTNESATTSIEVGADGLVTVKYLGDLIRREVTEIFEVRDTTYIFPVIDDATIPLPETEDGDRVQRMRFGPTSTMWLEHSNSTSDPVTATMTLPDFSVDGQPLSISVDVAPGTTATSDTINLEGVEVTPVGDSLRTALEVVDASGNPVSTFLSTVGYLDNFDVNYLEGLIVERVYPDLADEFIIVGIFENWTSGGATFTDPKFTVEVVNGFGTPVAAIFNQMSIETVEGETINLESSLIDDGVTVTYPSLDMVGQTTTTTFGFDKDNSNIQDLFGRRPERVIYDIDALVNPNSEEEEGFLDRSSFFEINIAVEVPLEGRINEFGVETNTNLDLSSLDDAEKGSIKVIFENSFPFDMVAQVYFKNDQGNVLDSLFDAGPTLLPSGEIGADARVESPSITTLEIPFDADRLDRLQTTTNVDVIGQFDTPEPPTGPVGIYQENNLVVKMGARVFVD